MSSNSASNTPASSALETRIIHRDRLTDTREEVRALLIMLRGHRLGYRIDLSQRAEALVLGRDPQADMRLDDDSVSRRHCILEPEGQGWVLKDLGSTNGTYVGHHLVERHLLRDGDLLRVGSSIFKFVVASDVEAAYHEEIYRLAIYDGLTQIHNRRYFDEFLEREISRSLRYQRPLTLMLFDIDHFKQINDTCGHLSGDHVLRLIAEHIRPRVRREELFARYAGDEFVILMPETDLDGGLRLGQVIKEIVDTVDFTFDGRTIKVTLSGGVAALAPEVRTPVQLLSAADAALYRAKAAGRDQFSP